MHPPLRDLLLDAAALVLPVTCTGCEADGRAICADCLPLLAPRVRMRDLGDGALPVWSGLEYADCARSVLLAFKNGGRTDLGAPLAVALRAAVLAALAAVPGEGLRLVPMARTRRSAVERGYDPVRVLLRRARLPATPLLRVGRRGEDQAGLGREHRFANAAHSLVASPRAAGRHVLLVDDVVTTGATLLEATRALCAAGAAVAGAVTVASTPRTHGAPSSGAPPVSSGSASGSRDFSPRRPYGVGTASR